MTSHHFDVLIVAKNTNRPHNCDNPGGDFHLKQTGMLVVSLRSVNFGFWSRLGCSGQSAKVSFRVPRKNTELREEKQKSNFLFNLFLGVKISLSYAQISLL